MNTAYRIYSIVSRPWM